MNRWKFDTKISLVDMLRCTCGCTIANRNCKENSFCFKWASWTSSNVYKKVQQTAAMAGKKYTLSRMAREDDKKKF